MNPESPGTNHTRRRSPPPPPSLPPAINLHIEELVLHGFAPGDRYRIGAAVERELARLVADQGLPGWLAQGGEVARLDGATLELAPGTKAEAVGAQVAQAVYRGLVR